jgi:MFS family permease
MLYPLVPIFVTVTLGAPATIVGLIEGIAEASASFLRLFSGWLSDRLGRRRALVIAGYALSATGKPLLAAAWTWLVVLVARFTVLGPLLAIPLLAVTHQGLRLVFVLSVIPAACGLSFALFAVAYLGLGTVRAGWQLWGLLAVYALYSGLTDGLTRALAPDLSAPQARGTAIGWV